MITKIAPCPVCGGHGYINGGNDRASWSKTCDRCHGFGYIQVPITMLDKIRTMSDEDLTDLIYDLNMEGTYCKNRKECEELLNNDGITDEMCKKCLLEYLRKPVEEHPKLPSGIYLDKEESGLTEDN